MATRALTRRVGAHASQLGLLAGFVAANAVLGASVASGRTKLVVLVAILPLLLGAVLEVSVARRDLLVYGALVLATVASRVDKPLPGTGGTQVFGADLIVVLTITGFVVSRLISRERREQGLRTVVLSWPFALFSIAVLIGVVRGHERYGTSYLSQPSRMIIYGAIALALVGVSAANAYRAIVVIFYVDAVWQLPQGLYYLAKGTSQTASVDLSTGGTRALALSTAMYLVGALVLALINLEFDDERRRPLHIAIAGIATFGIVIAFGRTNFVALAVVVPVLLLGLRRLRWTAVTWLPLAIPLVAIVLVIALQVRPSLSSTLSSRLFGRLSNDPSLITRQRKYDAALSGLSAHPYFGFGFGRTVQYTSIDRSVSTFSGDPENSYVWILAGGGFFALGSLILLIVAFFVDGFRRMRRAAGEARALIIFSLSLAFVFFLNALTGPILSDPTFMLTVWIAMLLPAVASRSTEATEAVGTPLTPRAREAGRLAGSRGPQAGLVDSDQG